MKICGVLCEEQEDVLAYYINREDAIKYLNRHVETLYLTDSGYNEYRVFNRDGTIHDDMRKFMGE